MRYFKENLDVIQAEAEKSRLEKELMLLRIIDEGRRKKVEFQEKVCDKFSTRLYLEQGYYDKGIIR